MSVSSPGPASLADRAAAPPAHGADLSPEAARILSRAERDRLVIFDPSSAPLLRPLATAADIRRWHVAPSDRWALAIPAGYSAALPGGAPEPAVAFEALAARHPAIGRHLRAQLAAGALRGGLWWELEASAEPPPGPRIIVAPGDPPVPAWDETDALVAAPAVVVPAADPYWLALLGSRAGSALLAAGGGADLIARVAAFPIPEAPGPQQASLGGLALAAANLARQIAELERAVLRRLLADFAPPGVGPSPRLERWWELEFAELREELARALRNDIPERFRPTWEQIHAGHRADRAAAAADLRGLEEAIEAQATALLGR